MARVLNFRIGGREIPLSPVKVERKKLYGWTELVLKDTEGNDCRRASINSDGVTIIDLGATKLGIVDENGGWVNRDRLEAVDAEGNRVEPFVSSFETGINLDTKVTADELLDVNVTSVYQLEGEGIEELTGMVGKDIFRFDFSYRTDYTSDPGYLLSAPAGLFLLVGRPIEVEFIGLDEEGVIEDTDDTELEDDDLDFSMM